MTNIKKYNIFIFLTTISKSMIEVFIPIILFNKGLPFKNILLFFLFKYIFLFIFSNVIKLLKIKNKLLLYISSFTSIITYSLLYFYKSNFIYLIIISLFYALYLISYWIPRHNIALSIIENKMTTERTSKFMIITLLGVIPSSLVGGYLISKFNFVYLIIIIASITFISLFFIFDSNQKEKKKKNLQIPFKNKFYLFIEQFKFISISLFPLFVYENINKSYTYVGLVNTITAVASIFSIFLLSKLMDKNKKDYLSISSIFLAISWILKITVKNSFWFIIITIFEGIFKFSIDTIILRNIYSHGKEYDSLNYSVYIENIRNISRIIISLIIIIFNFNISLLIILGIISLFISSFIKFDDGKFGYKKSL